VVGGDPLWDPWPDDPFQVGLNAEKRLVTLYSGNQEAVQSSLHNLETFTTSLARKSEKIDSVMLKVDGVMGKADSLMLGLNTIAGGNAGGEIAENKGHRAPQPHRPVGPAARGQSFERIGLGQRHQRCERQRSERIGDQALAGRMRD